MAVEIFKVENGSVKSTHVEPDDLRNHLNAGWVLEVKKEEPKKEFSESKTLHKGYK